MAKLTINSVVIDAPEEATILEAAREAGIAIPNLCLHKDTGACTSCMVCVVKDLASGRLVPSCATRVAEGMEIDAGSEEIISARREVLRMLLNEHAGDCEGPCSRICPAGLNVPRMLRYIASGDMSAAAKLAYDDLIFPATLGFICPAPCRKGCRRGLFDTPIDIPAMHRFAAESAPAESMVKPQPASHGVAIIGAGMAGLAAAAVCLRNGIACTVHEKREVACSGLRDSPQLPKDVLDSEIKAVVGRGAEIKLDCEVGVDIAAEELREMFDAVIVACELTLPAEERVLYAKEKRPAVRSVAQGKRAACAAVALLTGAAPQVLRRGFNWKIGKLRHEDLAPYAAERLEQPGASGSEYRTEAKRCLHCDCRKAVSCRLRQYAEEYAVSTKPGPYIGAPALKPIMRHGELLFEAGKCIKCGICVELLRKRGEDSLLTFVGRGFASRVSPPFDIVPAEPDAELNIELAGACPTGALAIRSKEETE